jgi:hypothetical protein
MKIDLTFAEHAGKIYQGTLVRTADAIDPASRTLLVEIDVDNRAGELLPGSLAQVHFKTTPTGPTFIVPARRSSSARKDCGGHRGPTATLPIWFRWSSARTTAPRADRHRLNAGDQGDSGPTRLPHRGRKGAW